MNTAKKSSKDDAQKKTPYFTKLKEYGESNPTPFDVPGHKLGHFENEMVSYVGHNTFKLDANAPRGLDNLNKPKGVIVEAQKLMAEATGAKHAYFLTNGSTQGILVSIMALCRANEEILIPRNVHKSVINALILSGGIPIFIRPNIDHTLGIANGVSFESVKEAIDENPIAKLLFLINPTYFGVVSDLERIIKYAHAHDVLVIVDEAHGSHFYFSSELPVGGIQAGADVAILSIHKTSGSLTQSSVLLTNDKVDKTRLRSTLNILNSTSPSALLLASLDVARKNMYFNGEKKLGRVIKLAEKARLRINKIPGVEAITPEYFINKGEFGYDDTRIIIKVSDLGITGFEAYNELRDLYNIQMELAETNLVLAILSPGTQEKDLNSLVKALEKLSKKHLRENRDPIHQKMTYNEPIYKMRPRDAYHSYKKDILLEDAKNEVAAESIMVYPPGIPIIIPGEVFTDEIIEDLINYKNNGSTILSDSGPGMVRVVEEEVIED